MNNGLIFLHLPKNGGTTFNSILNRIYPKENTFTLHTVDHTRTNKEDFINLSKEERNKIKLLKGHAIFGLHNYMNENTKYITFLRKPEERIISFYHYVLRKPNNKLYKYVVDNKMSLYDFVTNVTSSDLNNCQVRWISGINDKEEIMLEKALENIKKHFSFIGLTEKFDESLILLKRKYNWTIPYYKELNRTKKRPLIKEIDSKTLDAINNLNNVDNILYNKMERKINNQISNEKYFDLDLLRLSIYNKVYSSSMIKKIVRPLKRF